MATSNNRTIVVKCKTKLNKDDKSPVTSEVTIELDSEKDIDAFCGRAAIVAWQAIARTAGVIPVTDRVLVSDLAKRTGGGFKVTPESLANRVKKMPVAEYQLTLENLGLDKATVARMVKAHTAPVTK